MKSPLAVSGDKTRSDNIDDDIYVGLLPVTDEEAAELDVRFIDEFVVRAGGISLPHPPLRSKLSTTTSTRKTRFT